MKVSLFVIACLLSPNLWAEVLPQGTYKGVGLWKTSSNKGDYKTETKISGNSIQSTYTLNDGSTKSWSFATASANGNFFKVVVDNHEIGQGYCLDHATVCHYEVSVGEMSLEETLTFQNGKLYRFGSKIQGGQRVMWQEAME